jgi:hypothetical protein
VKHCRFTESHVTAGHCCGYCKQYGHGQVECKDSESRGILQSRHGGDIMPSDRKCSVLNCKFKWSHAKEAHHCSNCGERCHGVATCPLITYKIKCPICREINDIKRDQQNIFGSNEECCICLTNKANIFLPTCGHVCICNECCVKLDILTSVDERNVIDLSDRIVILSDLPIHIIDDVNYIFHTFDENEGKIYTTCYGGMGCTWFIRRDSKILPIEGFFMHSDNWGQYGIETDDRPYMNIFIDGYALIRGTNNISV